MWVEPHVVTLHRVSYDDGQYNKQIQFTSIIPRKYFAFGRETETKREM